VFYERIEILVAVEQCESFLDAAGRDQCVEGFSYRDAARPQSPEVPGRLNGNISPDQINDRQRSQQLLALVEILNAAKTLKDFSQDQIAGGDRLVAEEGVQSICLRILLAAKIVDPYAGIDSITKFTFVIKVPLAGTILALSCQ
jgi:hypothetical protein